MAREVTLFTGQWADLPLEELAAKASAWGFDGLELACWAITSRSTRRSPTTATWLPSASCSTATD